MEFQLESDFQPTGDQPEAIRQLVDGLNAGVQHQTLLGVTGSGKTFTVANVIKEINRPTLILSHNKTLAAQLYGEFKQFFRTTRHLLLSYMGNSNNSSLIMLWNILFPIMIITSLRHSCPLLERTLKRIYK